MCVHHVFNGIGNDVSRGQAVEHAVVAHGDAVVNGNCVELLCHSARRFNLPGNQLPQILEMHVPGYELSKGIDHGNDGFLEISILHAGGAPQCSSAGHIAAVSRCFGAIIGHVCVPFSAAPVLAS